MKVVHVIAKDVGGAARAAMRINQALQSIGVDSSILVLRKTKENPDVNEIFKNIFSWNMFRIVRKINNFNIKRFNLWSLFYEAKFGKDLTENQFVKNADIINLHWINDGMLSQRTLKKLIETKKRIVWTLHDMYAFTAGCYYDNNCLQLRKMCQKCPLAKGNGKIEAFIAKQFDLKRQMFVMDTVKFVGCSNWMSERAKSSPLLKQKNVITIPNPIDTEVFKPYNGEDSFACYKLNSTKKIVLFGAMSADSNERKGYQYLKKALLLLDPAKYQAVVFGNNNSVDNTLGRLQVIGVGKIDDDWKLVQLYSKADVFVAPSKQENLSNAVMESLACGTPVVAFNIGGMPDMIEHKWNGYLAKPYDAEDLAAGIEYSVTHNLHKACTESVTERFSMKKIGQLYLSLYQSIV